MFQEGSIKEESVKFVYYDVLNVYVIVLTVLYVRLENILKIYIVEITG